jgi:hypothetical protein
MSLFDDTHAVERPVFFDGQQLDAGDLQGLAGFHQALRWLHNRSLHQPGVGNGFAVAGRRGDREVRIDPGYALDFLGREIVLLEPVTEPVPPVAADTDGGPVAYDITVAYPGPEDLEEAETREGVCLPGGAVRLREKPVVCWVRLAKDVTGRLLPVDPRQREDIRLARSIVLTRAYVRNCKLDADLVIAPRRNARPDPCPHIACGRVSPVDWQLWAIVPMGDDGGSPVVGLFADVDTSAGAFKLVPAYMARVEGPRPIEVFPFEGPGTPVLDVPGYVSDPTVAGLRLYVPVVSLGGELSESMADQLVERAKDVWDIVWMGVEP